jgi:1-acyl-sn-glycerol-3-phosphate acyltransferase
MNAAAARSTSLVAPLRQKHDAEVPDISRPLLRLFSFYTSHYLRRHFGSIYLSGEPPNFADDRPAVIYLNHASWWDPLACLLLSSHFTHTHRNYAPIDARSLNQFRFFSRLGFFGVQKDSRRGAVDFLRTASAILHSRNAILWVTPQGEFVAQRVRPLTLKSGLAELARIVPEVSFVPLSLDYFFGDERLPVIAARFGDHISAHSLISPVREENTSSLAAALERTQDVLRDEVISKRIYNSRSLLKGSAGMGGIYGMWQGLRRNIQGRPA